MYSVEGDPDTVLIGFGNNGIRHRLRPGNTDYFCSRIRFNANAANIIRGFWHSGFTFYDIFFIDIGNICPTQLNPVILSEFSAGDKTDTFGKFIKIGTAKTYITQRIAGWNKILHGFNQRKAVCRAYFKGSRQIIGIFLSAFVPGCNLNIYGIHIGEQSAG